MQNQKPTVKGKVRRQTSQQLWSIVTRTAAALWPTLEERYFAGTSYKTI